MHFLSCKAALIVLIQYGSSSDLSFLLKTALERRVRLQNPGRKGGIETEKILLCIHLRVKQTQISSDWTTKRCYFNEWLSTETQHNKNCLLVASTETLRFQQCKAAFQHTGDLSVRKLRHKAGSAVSTRARRKSLSQAAGLTPSNTTLNFSIPLAAPCPSRSGNCSSWYPNCHQLTETRSQRCSGRSLWQSIESHSHFVKTDCELIPIAWGFVSFSLQNKTILRAFLISV